MYPKTAITSKRLTDLLEPEFMNRLDSLDVMSRKILRGRLQGQRRSKRRGQSVEFADHRPYVTGDDLRFVDWNIYARLEQLFLKLFLEEQDLTVHIVCDMSASMTFGEPSKERFIMKLAAALGYVSLVNNNRVTMSLFADGITGRLINMRGRIYLHKMADYLLTARAGGHSNFAMTAKQLSSGRIGSGITIVLSDYFFKDGYEEGLRRLISPEYDLYVIQVLCNQEMSPDITGELKLIDVEDDDIAEVTVNAALLKYYKRNLEAYCSELKEFCIRRGAEYVLANAADSVESLVLNYLRRIHLLR
jgi:uncharacterized protein (DUF58 family)